MVEENAVDSLCPDFNKAFFGGKADTSSLNNWKNVGLRDLQQPELLHQLMVLKEPMSKRRRGARGTWSFQPGPRLFNIFINVQNEEERCTYNVCR